MRRCKNPRVKKYRRGLRRRQLRIGFGVAPQVVAIGLPQLGFLLFEQGAEVELEAADALEMGIIDYLSRAGHGVIIVEWAEKILSLLPEDILKVQFQVLSARKRRLELKTTGKKYDYLFGALRKR